MTVEVEAAGRRHTVGVRQVANGWIVTTEGRERVVGVAAIGGRWSVLVGPAEAGHYVPRTEAGRSEESYVVSGFSRTTMVGFESFDIAIESLSPGELLINVNGSATHASVASPGGIRPRRWRPSGSAGTGGPRRVTAPMPGRIVKVLVRTGERVAARQGLVVVEAMKMENELRAPVTGTVSAVRVSEGDAVEANAVLVEME